MAIQKILKVPNALLRQKSARVEKFDSPLRGVIQDMIDTLYDSPGVALAAPQIGILLRVIVIDVTAQKERNALIAMVNPEIVSTDEKRTIREGCLSLPAYTANVERFQKVEVKGFDVDGKPISKQSEGLEAVAFQHELDHLEGGLFIDRVSSLKTDIFRRKRY